MLTVKIGYIPAKTSVMLQEIISKVTDQATTTADHIELHQFGIVFVFPQMLKNTGGVFLGDIDNRVKILPINIRCAFLQDLGNNGIIKGGVVYLHHLIADKQSALMGAVLLGKHMRGRIMNIDVSTYKDENGKTAGG